MRNKILYFSVFSISTFLFIVSAVILSHAYWHLSWQANSVEEAYPNFGYFIVLIGENASLLFFVFLFIYIMILLFLAYKWLILFKNAKYYLFSCFIFIILVELLLRILGYSPGNHTRNIFFSPNGNLSMYSGFTTDTNGIFKISVESGSLITDKIKNKNTLILDNEAAEVFVLAKDFTALIDQEIDNELKKKYTEIKKEGKNSDLDSLIFEYISSPINADGFRSIPFKKIQHNKPSVLLIGDSFTWGHSTSNKTNSFADELLAKGYVVYNSGISGTDVAQYLAIANKYIPLLKPDFVVVNFYLGNDINYFKREPLPYKPVFFPTHAGNLMNAPHGIYFNDPKVAYNNTLANFQIPKKETFANQILSITSIGSIIWKYLYNSGYFKFLVSNNLLTNYYIEVNKHKYAEPYSNFELKKIKEISEENGSQFILSSIPEVYWNKLKTTEDFPDLFGGLSYVEMDVDKKDYNLNDGHFNDIGHKKYAEFLEKTILEYNHE